MTTDQARNCDDRRRYWEQRWVETLRSHGDDEYALLPVALEALEEFPGDWQFLYRAAVDEFRIAQQEPDFQKQMEIYGKAAEHARLSLESDPDQSAARWVLEQVQGKIKA
jgi:hypothetical protein